MAVQQILKANNLSVADDKITVEVNEAEKLVTVTTRFPTAAQTNTAVALIGNDNDNDNDNVFWPELQGSMAEFSIAQVGEVQQIEVRFDPPALPGSAPPSPPLSPQTAGLTTSSSELEVSEIAGIAVGSVVVTLLLCLVAYLVRNKRRVNKANANMLKEMARSSEAVTLERGESEFGARTTVAVPAPASLRSTRTSSAEGLAAEGSASGHFSQR